MKNYIKYNLIILLILLSSLVWADPWPVKDGIGINPGSDIDASIVTVDVTGTPAISWDESDDLFDFSKGIRVPGGSLHIGDDTVNTKVSFINVTNDPVYYGGQSGLDDLVSSGTYVGIDAPAFIIQIDGISTDTFQWLKITNGVPGSWTTDVPFQGLVTPVLLSDGISVAGATSGHKMNDQWIVEVGYRTRLDKETNISGVTTINDSLFVNGLIESRLGMDLHGDLTHTNGDILFTPQTNLDKPGLRFYNDEVQGGTEIFSILGADNSQDGAIEFTGKANWFAINTVGDGYWWEHNGPDVNYIFSLNTTGTNGSDVTVHVGDRNPHGLMNREGYGSLYLRGDSAGVDNAVYIHKGGTGSQDWHELFALNTDGTASFLDDVDVVGSLSLPDDGFIKLGAGDDFQIWHDGTNSNILNSVGDLVVDNISATSDIIFQLGSDAATSKFIVENNSTTDLFVVSGDGAVDISGNLTVDGNIDTAGSLYQNSQPSEAGLIYAMDFEQYGSVTQYDKSSSPLTTTLYNGATASASNGFMGSGLNCDNGFDQYATTDNNLGITGAAPWTIQFRSILTRTSADDTWIEIGIGTTGKINFGRHYGNDYTAKINNVDWRPGATVDSNWHEQTITYNGTDVKWYVDGVLIGTNTVTLNITDSVVNIGKQVSAGASYNLDGNIANVKIWDRTLTEDEFRVASSMHMGDSVIKSDDFKIVDTSNNVIFDVDVDGDYILDNINTTGAIINRLGSDTTATQWSVQDNSETDMVTALGNGHFGIGGTPETRMDIYQHSNLIGLRLRGTTPADEIGDIYMQTNGDMNFDLSSSLETVPDFIFTGGRVGVGTDNPAYSLHVQHATDDFLATFQSDDTKAGYRLQDNSSTVGVFNTNGVYSIDINNDGTGEVTVAASPLLTTSTTQSGDLIESLKLENLSDTISTAVGQKFSTSSTGISKGGIFFQNDGTGNGRGTLYIANDGVNDANEVMLADADISITSDGVVTIINELVTPTIDVDEISTSKIVYVNATNASTVLPGWGTGTITLAESVRYVGDNAVTGIVIADTLKFNTFARLEDITLILTNATTGITAETAENIEISHCTITYTGAGTFFSAADIGSNNVLANCVFYMGGTGQTFCDLTAATDPNTFLIFDKTIVAGSANFDIGTIDNIFVSAANTQFIGFNQGLSFQNNTFVNLLSVQTVGSNSAATHLSFEGTDQAGIQLNGVNAFIQSNEYAFNLNSGTTFNAPLSASGCVMDGAISNVFEPGSHTQADNGFKFIGNTNIPDSTSEAEMYVSSELATTLVQDIPSKISGTFADSAERFITTSGGRATYSGNEATSLSVIANPACVAGSTNQDISFYISMGNDTDNTITSFGDAGGGQITVTTDNPHGLSNGDRVPITGTTSYNDTYTIANIAPSTFEITDTYAGTDTGYWQLILERTKTTNTIASTTKTSSTSVLGKVDFSKNVFVEIFVENNSGSNTVTAKTMTVLID